MTSKQKKDGQGDFRKSHQSNAITSTTTTTTIIRRSPITYSCFCLYLTLLTKLKGQDSRTIIQQQEWFLQFAEEDGDVIYVLLGVLHQHCAQRRKWKGNVLLLPLPAPSADGLHTARQAVPETSDNDTSRAKGNAPSMASFYACYDLLGFMKWTRKHLQWEGNST